MTGDKFGVAVVNRDSSLLGPADPARIDVTSSAELRHWVRELGLPAEQIKDAVTAAGPLLADVRDHLRKKSLYRLR